MLVKYIHSIVRHLCKLETRASVTAHAVPTFCFYPLPSLPHELKRRREYTVHFASVFFHCFISFLPFFPYLLFQLCLSLRALIHYIFFLFPSPRLRYQRETFFSLEICLSVCCLFSILTYSVTQLETRVNVRATRPHPKFNWSPCRKVHSLFLKQSL